MDMKTGTERSERHVGNSKLLLSSLFVCGLLFTIQATCFAATIDLQWVQNTEADLAGYKVYYKVGAASLPFDETGATIVDVGNKTTTSIGNLDASQDYTFAVTAYNTAGVESSFSKAVTVVESLPPSISITSPSNAATISGTESVLVSANDNVGVTKVEYYIDGTLSYTDTASPYVFSWNTSTVANKNYTLLVKAYDAAGNVGQSSQVTVTVINDSTAPVTALTSPVNNATVNGTITMAATASDNVGVTRVEFYENGVLLAATNAAPYSFNWDTKTATNGSYTLISKAYDNKGNVGQSSVVTVLVANDTTAPSVAISSPGASTTVSGTVAVQATATDNVGVAKVEYYLNGVLQSTDTTAPFGFSWDTSKVANGSYILTTKAYDTANNVATSNPVTVNVNNISSTTSVAGDLNGDGVVNVADAQLALKMSSGSVKPNNAQLVRGDVAPRINGKSVPNGQIDMVDAIVILSMSVAL
jgi:uncharacterized protein involved in tellurium resistance